jgi:glucan biosynthesis protein C
MENQNIRRHDLDWVRVITIFLVFLYHSSLFFWTGWWYIKNAQTSDVTDFFVNILGFWMMPLLFVIAGSAAFFSIGRRSNSEFKIERVLRLLVPFFFGLLVLVPPMTYLDRMVRGYFSGSFIQYLPHFFQGLYSMTGPSSGDIHNAHLWFLLYLFVVTLMALPIVRFLVNGKGKTAIGGLSRLMARPGAIYLSIVPSILISLALAPVSIRTYMVIGDWSYILCVLSGFLFGFIYCMDMRFWDAIEKQRAWSLSAALVATGIWIILWIKNVDTTSTYSLSQMPFTALWVTTTWLYVLAVLGYARRHLSFSNRFLAYTSEASLPFYVLHLPVVVVVGFFVVPLNIAAWAKYLMILAVSFTCIMMIYEFVIKRVNLIRFLFGMRSKTREAVSATAKSKESLGVNAIRDGWRA